MRRIAVLALLIGIVYILPAAARSTAAPATPTIVATVNGFCFASPFNQLVPCPTTPTTRRLIPVDKTLAVSGPIGSPADTTSYTITITSRHVCFALNEPINVFALGSAGGAVISPIHPPPAIASTTGSSVTTNVDQVTGTADLLLEVLNRLVGPEGLAVKAVWSKEQLERIVQVIAPTIRLTSTPVPTATPVATPVATATAAPTPTAGPFTVRACVDPPVVRGLSLGGDFATLYGETLPGAVCTASISYYKRAGTAPVLVGSPPPGTPTPASIPTITGAAYGFYAVPQPTEVFNGSAQTALSDQLVVYPWHPYTLGDVGIALVTCSFDNQAPITACTGFLIAQNYDADITTNLLDLPRDQQVAIISQLETRLCPRGSVLSQ